MTKKYNVKIVNAPANMQPIIKASNIPIGAVFYGTLTSEYERWPGMYVRAGLAIFSLTTPGEWFNATTTIDTNVENFQQIDIKVEVTKLYD